MRKITGEEFNKDKLEFFKKHNFDYTIHTSDMNNNSYTKVYTFEDGHEFYECFSTKIDEVPVAVEVHSLTFNKKVLVKYYVTEYWSTEFSSRYYFEKGE